jgi:orotate phosphoribosyltransferase
MLLDEHLEAIALRLHEIGAVRLGRFTLHSGRTSPIYIDLRLLASYPKLLRQTAAAYSLLLQHLNFDLLSAAPLAGLPIGTALSLEMNIPLIYPRLTSKAYGTGKKIEGHWQRGQTVVVVDDLITSGASLLQTIAVLEEEGMKVNDVGVLIDREQGGKEHIEIEGYNLHCVMSISHLLELLENAGRITAQQVAEIIESLA